MPDLIVKFIGETSSLKRAYSEAHTATKSFGDTVQKTSGHVRSFQKDLLIAGGALIGAGSIYEGLKTTITAAEQFNVAQRQLQAQLKTNKESFAAVSPWLDKLNAAQVQLGFTSTQTEQAFTRLDRASGSAAIAYKYMGVTADLARAKNIDLQQAALLVGKVIDGNTSALNRYGIAVPKGTSATEALAIAQQKLAGQARASVTPFEQFHAALNNIQIIIGEKLLPFVDKYLGMVTQWLSSAKNQQKITQDVGTAMKDLGKFVDGAWQVFKEILPTLKTVARDGFEGLKTQIEVAKGAFELLAKAFGKHKTEMIAAVAAIGVAITVAIGPEAAAIVGAVVAVGYIRKHWTGISGFFKTLLQEVENSFIWLWDQIKIGALKAALAAVEPFSHLPSFLGGWAKKAKENFQTEIDKIKPPNMDWSAAAAQAGVKSGAAFAQGFHSATIGTYGPPAPGTTLAGAASTAGTAGGGQSGTTTAVARQFIMASAASFGLDPAALIGVANNESGGWSGKAGDQGTSFGPFQLHAGGALPSAIWAKGAAYANAWAWSPAGINYALNAIAASGAKGLTGSAAVSAIVNNFERPASTTADITAGNAQVGAGLPPGTTTLPVTGLPRTVGGSAKRTLSFPDVVGGSGHGLIFPNIVGGTGSRGLWGALPGTVGDTAHIPTGMQLLSPSTQRTIGLQGGISSASITTLRSAQAELKKLQQTWLGHGLSIAVADEMGRVNKAIRTIDLKAANAKVKAGLAEQKAQWQAHVRALQTIASNAKSAFGRAFTDLANAALNAFDRATQKGLTALQAQQAQPTPAEAALASLQDAHDTAALQDQLAADQAAGDAKAVAEDLYNIQVAALTKQANLERTARDADFAAQEQNYQDQQDAQKNAFQTELANLQNQIVAKHETVAQANADILNLMSSFGLDPTWFTSGQNAGSALIGGLAAAFSAAGASLGTYDATSAAVSAAQAAKPGTKATAARPSVYAQGGAPQLHAAGGTFMATRATWLTGRDIVGERGPELVRIGGAAAATTYNFYFPNYVGNERELAQTVRTEFAKMQKRGTRLGITS